MNDTHYVEPTGLSSQNQSSARDLAMLVKAAHEVPLIRELSTSPEYMVEVGNRPVQFHTTNGLVKNPEWDIGLQKTGYITEAGPLPGDAGQARRPPADHGVPRFGRQVFAHRRRRARPPLDQCASVPAARRRLPRRCRSAKPTI